MKEKTPIISLQYLLNIFTLYYFWKLVGDPCHVYDAVRNYPLLVIRKYDVRGTSEEESAGKQWENSTAGPNCDGMMG